ncbi:MAG: hypothetical protein RLZZ84_366 [Pseudomonadota bacterium]|jgi:hypothetical protein
MNMQPTFTARPTPGGSAAPSSGRPGFEQATGGAIDMKWAVLHEAAAVVAQLAGLESEATLAEILHFPAVIREAGGWRRTLAEQGIEDLSAIMEPGLAALLTVHARGIDPAAAARSLWQEFAAARTALLSLAPPPAEVELPRLT